MDPKIVIEDVEYRRDAYGNLVVDDYEATIGGVATLSKMEIYEIFFSTRYDNLSTQCDLHAFKYALECEEIEQDRRDDVRDYRRNLGYRGPFGGHLESSLHSPELG